MDEDGQLYALVAFDGGSRTEVERVVMLFPNPGEADQFAKEESITDYVVGPVAFAAGTVPQAHRRSAAEDAENDPRLAAVYRAYIMTLLERDAETDDGGSPLTAADYRRAMFALLGLDPVPPATEGRAMPTGELAAYQAGQRAAYDAMAVAVGKTWRPSRRGVRDATSNMAPSPAAGALERHQQWSI